MEMMQRREPEIRMIRCIPVAAPLQAACRKLTSFSSEAGMLTDPLEMDSSFSGYLVGGGMGKREDWWVSREILDVEVASPKVCLTSFY